MGPQAYSATDPTAESEPSTWKLADIHVPVVAHANEYFVLHFKRSIRIVLSPGMRAGRAFNAALNYLLNLAERGELHII